MIHYNMVKACCYILLSLFINTLIACQPINYNTLHNTAGHATIYFKKEITGKREAWDEIYAYCSKIDGKRPGIFSNQNIAYLSPGKHVIEILGEASFGQARFYSVLSDEDGTGPVIVWAGDPLNSKEWDDTKVLEVDLLPGQEYDLHVSINMLEDKGEIKIVFSERNGSN